MIYPLGIGYLVVKIMGYHHPIGNGIGISPTAIENDFVIEQQKFIVIRGHVIVSNQYQSMITIAHTVIFGMIVHQCSHLSSTRVKLPAESIIPCNDISITIKLELNFVTTCAIDNISPVMVNHGDYSCFQSIVSVYGLRDKQ